MPCPEWESWGFCSTTCGVGQRTRSCELSFIESQVPHAVVTDVSQVAACAWLRRCLHVSPLFRGRKIVGLRGVDGHGCYEALGEVQVAYPWSCLESGVMGVHMSSCPFCGTWARPAPARWNALRGTVPQAQPASAASALVVRISPIAVQGMG